MTRVLFGLGNPGKRYEHTRHNVGFLVLERIARDEGAVFRPSRFFAGEEASYREGALAVRLVKPTTFMNLCGPAYVRALGVFDVPPAQALVVVDDFMLPYGRLRLRDAGSAGGHNGLKSIQEALGSEAYPRLRIGVGPVPPPIDPADFVLGGFSAEERKTLAAEVERAASAARLWVREGLEAAGNRFNGA